MLLQKLGSFIFELLQVVVFAVSIFLFIYLLVLQPHKIRGASMEPSFFDGEYLLTDKLSYRFGDPSRGDVVVFKAPPTYSDEFIKRIIALPGDEVRVERGNVFINGRKLDEPYLSSETTTNAGRYTQEGVTVVVPEGAYLVLGDNREHSLDSRNIGPIERQYITGRAWLVYWPVSKSGIIPSPIYLF